MEVYRAIKRDAFIACCALLLLSLVFGWGNKDDTDSADRRSGLTLRTDYGTGCQYLEGGKGVLIPRLDQSGKQVCKP